MRQGAMSLKEKKHWPRASCKSSGRMADLKGKKPSIKA